VGCGPDADVCREHLGDLLTEEIGALRGLEELLEREHEVLGASNIAAIERTALLRQTMMGELARKEEQRRLLCTSHGYTADWVGLESLLQWCDPQGSLLSRLRECARRASRCRDLNDRNGILVAARLRHVQELLGALTGGASRSVIYGPNGATAKLNHSREWGSV